MTKFEPKGEDVIRQEVVADLKGDNEDFKEEDFKDTINRITKTRLKDEEMKASLHKQKTQKEEELRKREEEKAGKPKGDKTETKKPLLSSDDKAYLYGSRMQMTRTEVRHLEKVMKVTGKSWGEAIQDNLYRTWKKENDNLVKKQGSQLPASRGGAGVSGDDAIVKKFSQNLPKGFEKPKAN